MQLKLKLLGLLLLLSLGGYAQEHRKVFGQNRLQFKTRKWFYYSTNHYNILYYTHGQAYAQLALDYLEKEYEKMTDMLGYSPSAKTNLFIYHSPADLKQSNVGIDGAKFTVAGQTKFTKLQVEVAYPGSVAAFKQAIKYQLTHLLLNDMMFGGNLAEAFQSTYLMHLPDWFATGLANYVAYGWSVPMDDYVRDFFRNNKKPRLPRLENPEAGWVGQSIWNYIAVKYGKSNLSSILNLTRIIRSVEYSISKSLGISFRQFRKGWMHYYRTANQSLESAYHPPKKEALLVKADPRNAAQYTQVKLSPNGKNVAYIDHYNGKYCVNIIQPETKKNETILKGGYTLINQAVDFSLPLIAWISDTQLGVVRSRRGQNHLVTYDLNTKNRVTKPLNKFIQIKAIDFHDNGKLAVVSADVKGQNDLYLISTRRNASKRLTKDVYDDLDPQFIPGTDAIVFSSNRPNDSLKRAHQPQPGDDDLFNLFVYDLDTTKHLVHRITNTISNDTYPVPLDAQNIFFLSDQKGINNLYKYDLLSQAHHQVSNFSTSIEDYDISPQSHSLAYLMLFDGKKGLFFEKDYPLHQSTFTPLTLRNQRLQLDIVRKRREEKLRAELLAKRNAIHQGKAAPSTPPDRPTTEANENQNEFIDTDNYTFEDHHETISADHYTFEDEEKPPHQDKNVPKEKHSFLAKYIKMKATPSVTGPLPYETAFTSNAVITTFVIDPIRGFGLLSEYEMSDVLEDHKFYGGFMIPFREITESGQFFAEYEFLKYNIDFKARYDRNVYFYTDTRNNQEITQKYKLNRFTLGASLPFSVSSRFDLDGFVAWTSFYNLNPYAVVDSPVAEKFAKNSSYTFAGFKAQWVYDNTLTHGLNLYEGLRAKVALEHYSGINNKQRSFSNLSVDIRRYQKIHRELILAARVYYGSSVGRHPKTYMLGGVDNWIGYRTDDSDQVESPLYFSNTKDNTDVLFADFVPLRGFSYNRLSGHNVLTFSAELRFPIVKYFSSGAIRSNFFRNLQFIGFYDIGSSWTGASPFSRNNQVNTRKVLSQNKNWEALISTSDNPWLASYGLGIRTVLLGYYVRLDFAKPISDYRVGPLKFAFSIGYDF